jgi:hypothetical protein
MPDDGKVFPGLDSGGVPVMVLMFGDLVSGWTGLSTHLY